MRFYWTLTRKINSANASQTTPILGMLTMSQKTRGIQNGTCWNIKHLLMRFVIVNPRRELLYASQTGHELLSIIIFFNIFQKSIFANLRNGQVFEKKNNRWTLNCLDWIECVVYANQIRWKHMEISKTWLTISVFLFECISFFIVFDFFWIFENYMKLTMACSILLSMATALVPDAL